ncbi:MAG: L-threonylcarbamoyladenylate synthase [Actinomycetes bacterium]
MRRLECADLSERGSQVSLAAGALRRHQLVVLPTDTVYAVACDAFSPLGVERLNDAKGRTSVAAIPVMIGSLRALDGIVTGLSPTARELLMGFWPGPLTALCHAQPSLVWDLGGEAGAAAQTVAVRMPLHPVALDLLREVGPMAVIGANRVGEATPVDCDAAIEQLGDAVTFYLDAGPCVAGPPSSVVDLTGETPRLLRKGALSLDVLRQVMPELVDPHDEAPLDDQPASDGADGP